MAFDRSVCALGVKDFIRPTTPADQPDPAQQVSGLPLPPDCRHLSPWLRVREITPGLRVRLEADICFPPPLAN
jgi:hypothetical protein